MHEYLDNMVFNYMKHNCKIVQFEIRVESLNRLTKKANTGLICNLRILIGRLGPELGIVSFLEKGSTAKQISSNG